MTTSPDATGALHDTTDGRFAGHLKAETDPAVLDATGAPDWSGMSTQERYETEVEEVVAAVTAAGWKPRMITTEEGMTDCTDPDELVGYAQSAEQATIWFSRGSEHAYVDFGHGQDIDCNPDLEPIISEVLSGQ